MEQNAVHIGIIGMGPKGLYGFERLLANLHAIECDTIHIHYLDQDGFMILVNPIF